MPGSWPHIYSLSRRKHSSNGGTTNNSFFPSQQGKVQSRLTKLAYLCQSMFHRRRRTRPIHICIVWQLRLFARPHVMMTSLGRFLRLRWNMDRHGSMPVLTAYFPVLAYGISGKGGLFVAPQDGLTGLTGSSIRAGTGCTDLQLIGSSVATARHRPDLDDDVDDDYRYGFCSVLHYLIQEKSFLFCLGIKWHTMIAIPSALARFAAPFFTFHI